MYEKTNPDGLWIKRLHGGISCVVHSQSSADLGVCAGALYVLRPSPAPVESHCCDVIHDCTDR
jgi:hypothetical protein